MCGTLLTAEDTHRVAPRAPRRQDPRHGRARRLRALFSDTTAYFSPGTAPFMVNYRVRNLDRMVAQLRARGIMVDSRIVEEAAGRFTWVVDPEGNRIELWEPRQ